jgi:phage tail sheath protein FI
MNITMRLIILLHLYLFCNSLHITAQTNTADSLRKLKQSKISLSIEIENGLKKIMEEYRNKPNTEDTWTSIKNEAENFLFPYYKKGRLVGKKPQEAYFINIGSQTMTAADIQANKKILIAGFSESKPAEFKVITIETLPLKKPGKL